MDQERFNQLEGAIIQAAASLAAVSVAAQLPELDDKNEETKLKKLQEKYFRLAYKQVTAILGDIDEDKKLGRF